MMMSEQRVERTTRILRMLGGGSTAVVYSMVFLAIAMVITNSGRPGVGTRAEHGWSIDGHLVTKVKLDGRLISYERYQTEVVPAEPATTKLDLVVDPSAVKRGYLVAFRTPAESERYLRSVGVVIPAPVLHENPIGRRMRAGAVAAKRHSLNGHQIELVGCGSSYSIKAVYLYLGIGCTGDHLAMWPEDMVPKMPYLFNDSISSVNLGTCIFMLRMFEHANYLGARVTYYGPGSVGASSLGNQVSSATTPGTRC